MRKDGSQEDMTKAWQGSRQGCPAAHGCMRSCWAACLPCVTSRDSADCPVRALHDFERKMLCGLRLARMRTSGFLPDVSLFSKAEAFPVHCKRPPSSIALPKKTCLFQEFLFCSNHICLHCLSASNFSSNNLQIVRMAGKAGLQSAKARNESDPSRPIDRKAMRATRVCWPDSFADIAISAGAAAISGSHNACMEGNWFCGSGVDSRSNPHPG